jgi:hypothetical protein
VFTAVAPAKASMSAFRTLTAKCATTWTETDKDGKTTYTLSALSFPKIGDDRAAIQARIKSASALNLTIVADLVVVRSANAVILMAQSGVESTNAEQLAKLTKTAVTQWTR